MRKPGYMFSVDTGGKAIGYHYEQNTAFMALNKVFVHFLNDDFTPVLDEQGKPKTGLKSVDKLTVIGFTD